MMRPEPRWRLLVAGATGLALASCAANPAVQPDPVFWQPPLVPPTYDTAPVLTNEAEVSLELQEAYPPELHAAGIGGSVEVWVRVDTAGNGWTRHVRGSSGHDALDCAAMQVGSAMQFDPAMDAGNPTVAWIPRRVEFEPDPARPPPPDRLRCEPFDTSPFQLNAGDAAKLLERFYPKDLRARGVGGSVVLWLFVDESGNVARHDVKVSSGFEALDLAAVSVARMLRFAPARAPGIPTGVWVHQGLTFRVIG